MAETGAARIAETVSGFPVFPSILGSNPLAGGDTLR
jgi:hypothetical protein